MKTTPAKSSAAIPKKNGQKVEPTGKRIGKSRPAKANNQQNRRVK